MTIIKHAATSAQPTTSTFRVEELTIDVPTYDLDDLEKSVVDTYDRVGLVNATLTARDVRSARDREGGWRVFHAAVRQDPDKYKSGTGIRLVLVGGDR